jgi:hypothetical protein
MRRRESRLDYSLAGAITWALLAALLGYILLVKLASSASAGFMTDAKRCPECGTASA